MSVMLMYIYMCSEPICVVQGARSRDDCDMVRALRPRNHPDVVKSTLSTRDLRFNESTIDNILGAPNKIYIPERYMPDPVSYGVFGLLFTFCSLPRDSYPTL